MCVQVCVTVHVCERERESVCVCVCVCVHTLSDQELCLFSPVEVDPAGMLTPYWPVWAYLSDLAELDTWDLPCMHRRVMP